MAIATCAWVRSRLPLLAGGDSLGLDERHVKRHLLRCPACQSHLEGLEASQGVLAMAAAELVVPEGSIWPDLERQMKANPRPTVRSAWALEGQRRWSWAVPALGLAAGLLVAVGAMFVSPLGGKVGLQMADSKKADERAPRLLKPTAYEKAKMAEEARKRGRRTPSVHQGSAITNGGPGATRNWSSEQGRGPLTQ